MPRRKGDRDVSPRLRQQLMAGLELLAEQRGQSLSELLRDRWAEDFNGTGNLLVRLLPREHKIEAAMRELPSTDASRAWLAQQMQAFEGAPAAAEIPEGLADVYGPRDPAPDKEFAAPPPPEDAYQRRARLNRESDR